MVQILYYTDMPYLCCDLESAAHCRIDRLLDKPETMSALVDAMMDAVVSGTRRY